MQNLSERQFLAPDFNQESVLTTWTPESGAAPLTFVRNWKGDDIFNVLYEAYSAELKYNNSKNNGGMVETQCIVSTDLYSK
jgi:hypothetical protein